MGFPGGISGKEPACKCRRHETWVRSLGWEDSPRGRHGNPLQYSCLENTMDRGAWWATVHGVAKSWTWLKQLGMHAHIKYTIDSYKRLIEKKDSLKNYVYNICVYTCISQTKKLEVYNNSKFYSGWWLRYFLERKRFYLY